MSQYKCGECGHFFAEPDFDIDEGLCLEDAKVYASINEELEDEE